MRVDPDHITFVCHLVEAENFTPAVLAGLSILEAELVLCASVHIDELVHANVVPR